MEQGTAWFFIAVTDVLAAGLVLRRPGVGEVPVGMVGEGQLGVNTLAMSDVLADDSSTRKTAMEQLARPMADALTVPATSFADRWCGGMPGHCLSWQSSLKHA